MDFFSLRYLKTSFQIPFKSMRFAFDLAAIHGRFKESLTKLIPGLLQGLHQGRKTRPA